MGQGLGPGGVTWVLGIIGGGVWVQGGIRRQGLGPGVWGLGPR